MSTDSTVAMVGIFIIQVMSDEAIPNKHFFIWFLVGSGNVDRVQILLEDFIVTEPIH